MTSAQQGIARLASRLALIGGLIQALVALGLLLLPVFTTCIYVDGAPECHSQSYLQQGGSLVGYLILTLAILAGVVAVLSSQDLNSPKAVLSRWLAASAGVIVVAVGIWSIGIVFMPGTLVILLSALLTRPGRGADRTHEAKDA
ncbi:MAG TPA: hypothetical protein VFL17_20200 [Anaerolineae bacterium]|nr:hypothetical protein [Anaerolineae bacterium]